MFEIYYCGLRKGELRGLTWRDIDFVNKTLSVKNKSQDVVILLKSFNFQLQRLKEEHHLLINYF